MFERLKEAGRQLLEEQERQKQEERDRLLSLSEKELLVELLLELKDVKLAINGVNHTIRTSDIY